LANRILQNPYLFALLVGLHPPLFYISNNWFVFKPSLSLFIIAAVTLTIFCLLVAFFSVASLLSRKIIPGSSDPVARGLLVVAGAFVWIFLLRQTFYAFVSDQILPYVLLVLILGGLLGCIVVHIQLIWLNIALLMLCFASFSTAALSIASTESTEMDSSLEPGINRDQIERWVFPELPNVYYILADGYPNREALQKIYGMDNEKFYRLLESWGFTLNHSAYSNYVSTLPSVSSLFGMGHHYYRHYIGNQDSIGARRFITGRHNPTMSVFRSNGYRVHLVHQTDYLLKAGCYASTCSPSIFWEDAMRLLVPYRIVKRFGWLANRSLEGFEDRAFQHIEEIARAREPHFSYFHFLSPGHSNQIRLSDEQLLIFREEFVPKVRATNALMERLIKFVLEWDPDALIILNADHGGFGLGWVPARKFEGVPDYLAAIDHMGVLLAIRWPDTPPTNQPEIQSNVNLFRNVFAFLSDDEGAIDTRVSDHGYIRTDTGSLVKVVHDGKPLRDFEKIRHPDD